MPLKYIKNPVVIGFLTCTIYSGSALSSPVDGTAFVRQLVQKEIKQGERDCYKTMHKTAKCKIHIQKVTITKSGEDAAELEILSNLKIKTKSFIKAGADVEIKAKAAYQIKTCKLNIMDVSKKITKLSGAAKYLEPFKESLTDIEVPTGPQDIKNNETRNKADAYLEKNLKLASAKESENCETK